MVSDDEGYTGEVSPGGDPDVRTLGCLTLTKVAVDPEMSNNCYLLHCGETDELVLIDAAAEPDRLLELIGDRSLTSIVTTHQHWDHHRALAAVKAAHPGATVVAGAPDADAIEEQTGVSVDRRVGEGDKVAVGTCDMHVIPVAGHTPGSIVLLLDDPAVSPAPQLFTGDSLFPGGPGRTTSPADFASLMDDLEDKVFGRLDDETWFYPGHGNDSTLGAERPHLEEWRSRGW
jgi:glyoxylase-like metal-dependent hydrolase (beta-lactamase superfamily II)